MAGAQKSIRDEAITEEGLINPGRNFAGNIPKLRYVFVGMPLIALTICSDIVVFLASVIYSYGHVAIVPIGFFKTKPLGAIS